MRNFQQLHLIIDICIYTLIFGAVIRTIVQSVLTHAHYIYHKHLILPAMYYLKIVPNHSMQNWKLGQRDRERGGEESKERSDLTIFPDIELYLFECENTFSGYVATKWFHCEWMKRKIHETRWTIEAPGSVDFCCVEFMDELWMYAQPNLKHFRLIFFWS